MEKLVFFGFLLLLTTFFSSCATVPQFTKQERDLLFPVWEMKGRVNNCEGLEIEKISVEGVMSTVSIISVKFKGEDKKRFLERGSKGASHLFLCFQYLDEYYQKKIFDFLSCEDLIYIQKMLLEK